MCFLIFWHLYLLLQWMLVLSMAKIVCTSNPCESEGFVSYSFFYFMTSVREIFLIYFSLLLYGIYLMI